jgi:3-oxoacyl-[acyl-carrier-protein] synthase III
MPRLECLVAVHGDQVCTNEDVVRNSAYNWSPMSADEIRDKTGVEERRYTSLSLEELALQAAEAALRKAGRGPEEIGGVLVCTCTSSRLIPSLATYLCGQLGIYQTHAAYDLIGNVRPSRMLFADGAAALVVGPAPEGADPDVEYLQTYASGPASEVNSIIWPNPEFDNNITVFGPQVKALAGRYLAQMIEEIGALPDPAGRASSLLDGIDLIVPHQANKTMVLQLAERAGLGAERLYFNIERVGNASSASIPLAIHDAVRDGVISEPVRVFAPGFGAGAVAGYAVLRVDPAVVEVGDASAPDAVARQAVSAEATEPEPASEAVREAFG